MEEIKESPQKKSGNKTIFIIVLILLFVAILIPLLFLLNPSRVQIDNRSKEYSLRYSSSPEFIEFLNDINDAKKSDIQNVTTIKNVHVTVQDQNVAGDISQTGDSVNAFPVNVTLDQKQSQNDTVMLNLAIDPSKVKQFDGNLDEAITSLIVSLLYTQTHLTEDQAERVAAINKYLAVFRDMDTYPFRLTQR